MKPYIVTPLSVIEKDPRYPQNDPDSKQYKRRLLAEGDSWFSMGSIPQVENLLSGLDFKEKTIIVDLAEPGDEIVKIAAHTNGFKRFVVGKRTAYQWNAILLSGGGNDLMDAAGDILRKGDTVESCINQAALRRRMQDVENGYRTLAVLRDSAGSVNRNCQMIAHTYDFLTPRDSPARFFGNRILGPWLYKAFTEKEISQDLWIPVSKRLLDSLAETIIGLGKGKKAIPHFEVIDTRGTLIPADLNSTKASGNWRNEIHPNKDGYQKLAAKLAQLIP